VILFTSFVSVVGVACAADSPGLSSLSTIFPDHDNKLFIYHSTTTMERPPSRSGQRTRTKTARSAAPTPPHRTATPRASSSARRLQLPRRPASYAAALATPPRAGYYDPLCAATDRDDDNPFQVDSADDDNDGSSVLDDESPALLTDPAGVADPAGVEAATAVMMAIADASGGSGVVSGNDSNATVAAPSPLAAPGTAAPGTTAAVMADFALILKKCDANFALLLEKHVSVLNGRINTLHSEAASNHGHITKRLFPALEAKFASLENSLATTTQALEAKGESLLAKCTALEDMVSSAVERRLKSLESAVESPHTPASCPSGPREPPDGPPYGTTPGTSATPGDAGVLVGSFVPQDGAATCPCVERDNVDEEVGRTTMLMPPRLND
jgi:hypothetical protein